MSNGPSNYQLLRTVFRTLLEKVHKNAAEFEKAVIRASQGKEPFDISLSPKLEKILASRHVRKNEGTGKVYNWFVLRQLGVIEDLLLYLDQRIGPSDWPGVDLVNFATRERLSIDFGFDFSEIEQDFIDELRENKSSEE